MNVIGGVEAGPGPQISVLSGGKSGRRRVQRPESGDRAVEDEPNQDTGLTPPDAAG
jgi:hypothetical protein